MWGNACRDTLGGLSIQGEKSEKRKRFQQPKGDENGWGIAGKIFHCGILNI